MNEFAKKVLDEKIGILILIAEAQTIAGYAAVLGLQGDHNKAMGVMLDVHDKINKILLWENGHLIEQCNIKKDFELAIATAEVVEKSLENEPAKAYQKIQSLIYDMSRISTEVFMYDPEEHAEPAPVLKLVYSEGKAK